MGQFELDFDSPELMRKVPDVDRDKLGTMVNEWFQLKEQRAELEEQDKKLRTQQDALEAKIVSIMESEELARADCAKGSVTLKPKSMPRIVDFEAFANWVMADLPNRIGFLYRQVKEAAVNEMLQETGELPEGVDTYMKMRLNKRSARG